jgi:hypothetical protein
VASSDLSTSPRTPPPLLPRPPASYIQETAEEDARLQDELANGKLSATAAATNGATTETATLPVSVVDSRIGVGNDEGEEAFELLRRSTLPFASGWGSRNAGASTNVSTNGIGSSPPSSPPPRPPKVPLEY